MKRLLFLLSVIVCIAGCKKDTVALQGGLLGTWELRKSSGTIAGYVITYPPGNGNTLTFSDNNQYKNIYNDTLTSSGTYRLSNGSNACNGDEVVLINFTPNSPSSILSISGDTLNIGDNCIADGVYNEYQKIH